MTIHHHPVGAIHEERGRAEVDLEAGAADPSAVVDHDERMTELMAEDHEVVEDEQDDESHREGLPRQREPLLADQVHEQHDPPDARSATHAAAAHQRNRYFSPCR